MYIDKSFQLLATESGKTATDEARRPLAEDDNTEFSELLDAEQEQQKALEAAASIDKKAGQEVAAARAKDAINVAQIAADKEATEQSLVDQSLAERVLKESSDVVPVSAGNVTTDAGTTADLTKVSNNTQDTALLNQAMTLETVVDDTSAPWLSIISQSNDFKSILSQPTGQTSQGAPLTDAESLVADLLGVAVDEQDEQAALLAGSGNSLITDVDKKTAQTATDHTLNSGLKNDKALAGDALALVVKEAQPSAESVTPQMATMTEIATQESSTTAGQQSEGSDAGRTLDIKPVKLPTEQLTVQELVKTEQPDGAAAMTRIDPSMDSRQQQASNPELTKNDQTQPTQSKITAAADVSKLDTSAVQASLEKPVDGELSKEVIIEEKVAQSLLAGATTVTTAPAAKNAPPSFAQFQKTANAAAALVQKQQIKSEQSQQSALQEIASQQPQRLVAELHSAVAPQHQDVPAAFNNLLQSERPISTSGSSMGSSGGQQQQQATSQLFATRLNDNINSSQQSALSLLEPNAATQLKDRVMFQINQKIQSAEIKLAPEELGSMQIKVQLQQEQLSVQFVVQQSTAKEALEQQMPRLREMLEEQGIELTQGQVSQQGEGSDAKREARERNQALGKGADLSDEPLQQQAIVRVSDRMVDYYA